MSYPRAKPPDDLAEPPPDYYKVPHLDWAKVMLAWETANPRCKAETPAWGWEADSEQCQRRPHDDPWHYFGDSADEIWWRTP